MTADASPCHRPPDTVFLQIWGPCNARCQMCSCWQSPTDAYIPLERACELLEELDQVGVREVVLTGGEPFFYPGLDRMLDLVAGVARKIRFAVITNGSRRDFVSESIIRNPLLTRLHVSLDALDNDCMELIRGRQGWYSGVVAFVELVRRVAPDVTVVANAIINRHNKEHLASYFEHDFDVVNFLNLKGDGHAMALAPSEKSSVARKVGDLLCSDSLVSRLYIALDGSSHHRIDEDTVAYVWGGGDRTIPCRVTSRMAYINHEGELYPCNCLAHGSRTDALGNVLERGFAAVWRDGKASEFRAMCLSSKWRTCVDCDPANRLYNLATARRSADQEGCP